MTLHLINLPHRHDRQELLLQELEAQRIQNYVIWPGVLDTEKPARGIASAHQAIVRWAAVHSLPEVLIGEDDLHFTAPGAFDYFLAQKPTHFDIYLGGICWGNVLPGNLVEDFAGTHFYIIRQSFYDVFLSQTGEVDIDRSLAKKGKYVVCNPMVAMQHDGYSDNAHAYRNNTVYFSKRALWRP